MRYIVHLKQKRVGHVRVEAAGTFEALQAAKRMVAQKQVPKDAWGENLTVVTHAVQEL